MSLLEKLAILKSIKGIFGGEERRKRERKDMEKSGKKDGGVRCREGDRDRPVGVSPAASRRGLSLQQLALRGYSPPIGPARFPTCGIPPIPQLIKYRTPVPI